MKILLPNSNNKAIIPLKSNIEVLVGVTSLPPTLIPALQKIGILHHKKAKVRKHMRQSVFLSFSMYIDFQKSLISIS